MNRGAFIPSWDSVKDDSHHSGNNVYSFFSSFSHNSFLCVAYINMTCKHTILQLESSPFAELAGYEQPDAAARAAAETTSGRTVKNFKDYSTGTFPAPLVLPHDDLNYDPDCSPQSTKSWLNMKSRNKLLPTTGRNTLYVAQVPGISKDVGFMRDWVVPTGHETSKGEGKIEPSPPPADLFVDYLAAFYRNMPIRLFPTPLTWTTWGSTSKSASRYRSAALPKYVGLAHEDRCTRIRVRATPDSAFPAQLNLDDILDTAISILPADAYAIVLLVDHDIYESEDDDFCCGRAYGGSRVAVVQTARYNPFLDERKGEEIDRSHMWPYSHCKTFVDGLCAVEDVEAKPATKKQKELSKSGAMKAAIQAAATYEPRSLVQDVQALWFSRLARTVSHELGHCFGIAHCVYYACNMQGTGTMKEDVRQPPYLCPVCEAKVAHAIVGELDGGKEDEKNEWTKSRCEALRRFCGSLGERGMESAMWRGLDGWLEERMKTL
jgi:archaemetzincin